MKINFFEIFLENNNLPLEDVLTYSPPVLEIKYTNTDIAQDFG